jgi:pepF/M3 family oligoendopeptidase
LNLRLALTPQNKQLKSPQTMTTQTSLGALPHWDVSTIYPSLESKELRAAIAKTQSDVTKLRKFLDANDIRRASKTRRSAKANAALIEEFVKRANALHKLYLTIQAYLTAFVTTDSFNAVARKLESETEPIGVQLSQLGMRFQGWLGDVEAQLPAAIKSSKALQAHAFFLNEAATQSQYLMSDAEEALASELSLSGANAWSKLQGTLTSQMTVPFERGGKVEQLSMPALINVMWHDTDPAVRERAYHTEHAAWKSVEEPLAACMNGIKGAVNTLNSHRRRTDALHDAIDQARIDRATLNAMIGAMQDSFPIFRKYLRKKAQRLGHNGGLPWWDLFAPIGHNERTYTWGEAREFVLQNFGKFSGRLASFAQRAFDENWIDAEQRAGKRAGAFCMGVPLVDESRILCNYDGSLDQVSTIAHELGHAFHNECQVGKQPLQVITPMTLAETASIFCETIIVDAALAQAQSREEELSILETDLIGKTQVIVDITSRYLFEQEVFKRRATAELSADELSALMLDSQKQTYGDGLDARYLHKYMWTWKPHYYSAGLSFYNFPYAFGLLFATGLYAIYQKQGSAFVKDYEHLLASTGEADAADLAARFGINIRKKAFWKASLDLIGKRIERYCEL